MNKAAPVVVVGGGPAGSAAATVLARGGASVILLDRQEHPRDKVCGDAITPKAVAELTRCGIGVEADEWLRIPGIRLIGDAGSEFTYRWDKSDSSRVGYGIRRSSFDHHLISSAERAGATVYQGVGATAALRQNGRVTGVVLSQPLPDGRSEIEASHVVCCEGAISEFGRSLELVRNRDYPMGMAIRGGYYECDPPECLDLYVEVDPDNPKGLLGYGWVFPLPGNLVNAGVGIVSSGRRERVNLTNLMNGFERRISSRYNLELLPADRVKAGRLPLGASVSAIGGNGFLVCGDAAGLNNPFIAEGIGFALESGRLAAEALLMNPAEPLEEYRREMRSSASLLFKAGRRFCGMMEHPRLRRASASMLLSSKPLSSMAVDLMDGTMEGTPSRMLARGLAARVPEADCFSVEEGA